MITTDYLSTMTTFVLNPGDFLDVTTFTILADALTVFHYEKSLKRGARLYRCFRKGSRPNGRWCWEEFTTEYGWNSTDRGNLQYKVIEAGELECGI